MMRDRAGRPASALAGRVPALPHPPRVVLHPPADVAGARRPGQRLNVTGAVAKAAVLVEVASHEADRAVVVRMQHRRAGVVGLLPAAVEQLAAEGLVLGVGHVVETDLLPALAPVAGVHVREESRVAGPLHHRVPIRGERREEVLELARDHRAGLRPRQVRPVGCANAFAEGERLAVRVQPAGDRLGVLGQEADQLARRALRAEVARAAVAERFGFDLDDLCARRAGDLTRRVA